MPAASGNGPHSGRGVLAAESRRRTEHQDIAKSRRRTAAITTVNRDRIRSSICTRVMRLKAEIEQQHDPLTEWYAGYWTTSSARCLPKLGKKSSVSWQFCNLVKSTRFQGSLFCSVRMRTNGHNETTKQRGCTALSLTNPKRISNIKWLDGIMQGRT
ncbi:hypothetical protein AcV5_002866 [Taiwanofungus camphoratus]|nr:hypothetical protein AcV5_002866 [Antrodia cinnamomea]